MGLGSPHPTSGTTSMPHDEFRLIDEAGASVRPHLNSLFDAVRRHDYESATLRLSDAWRSGMSGNTYRDLCSILKPILDRDEREITSHGIFRSFRFWSVEEKRGYLETASELVVIVRERVTPQICVAYGTALAIARSNDLIPHDDDVDLLLVLPSSTFKSFGSARSHVADCIQDSSSFLVATDSPSTNLIKTYRGPYKVDIFIGLEESASMLACFPGPRDSIHVSDVFPAQARELFGVSLPFPARGEVYLRKVYGENWRTPDPQFSHNWDISPYADIWGAQ